MSIAVEAYSRRANVTLSEARTELARLTKFRPMSSGNIVDFEPIINDADIEEEDDVRAQW